MWRIPEGFPCVCLEPVSPARYPASWHFFLQMELKAGKGASERPGPDWKAALQREREEQQHLLAESYSAVMELTRQLQMSERHWSQEKLQLVERLQGEKQQVEQQVKELQNRLSQVRPFCRGNWSPELRESRESQVLSSKAVFRAPRHTSIFLLRSYTWQPHRRLSFPEHVLQLSSCDQEVLSFHKFSLSRCQSCAHH